MKLIPESEWKENLSENQFKVLRQKETEAPFSGQYDAFWSNGIYKCAGCGSVLFASNTKYDAGCGWPSFWKAINDDNIILKPDYSHGLVGTEVTCGICGGHLGHLFDDGPKQNGGKRYCINSASLSFESSEGKNDT